MMDVDDVVFFSAAIYLVGQNRCVDVPSEGFEGGGDVTVPIVLTVGGRSVSTNLVPRGDGRFRVFVNSDLRKAAGADTGDSVDVEIRLDLANRDPEIPPELLAALKAEAWGLATFRGLTINQRREIVRFVLDAKHDDTKIRRVARVMEVLTDMKSNKE